MKSNVKFQVLLTLDNRHCRNVSAQQAKTTVFVISWEFDSKNGLDYVICDSDVIESWSYDTQEHYDEVVADANWVLSHLPGQYSLYASNANGWYYMKQAEIVSENGRRFDQETFERSLHSWNEAMAKGLGGVYFNSDVPEDRREHFRSRHPIYYNPK